VIAKSAIAEGLSKLSKGKNRLNQNTRRILLLVLVMAMVSLSPMEVSANVSSLNLFYYQGQDAVRNADFEDWTGTSPYEPDLWTETYGEWDRSLDELHASYAAYGYRSTGYEVRLSQSLPSSARTAVAGKTVEFGFWFKSPDGKTSANAYIDTSSSGWVVPSTTPESPWKYVYVRRAYSSVPSSITVKICGDNRVDSATTQILVDRARLVIYDSATTSITAGALALAIRINEVTDLDRTGYRTVYFDVGASATRKSNYYVNYIGIVTELGYNDGLSTQHDGKITTSDPYHENDLGVFSNPVVAADGLHAMCEMLGIAATLSFGIIGTGVETVATVGSVFQKGFIRTGIGTLIEMFYSYTTPWDNYAEGPCTWPWYLPAELLSTRAQWGYSSPSPTQTNFVTHWSVSHKGIWEYNTNQIGNSQRYLKVTAYVRFSLSVYNPTYHYYYLSGAYDTSVSFLVYC
jgi:hypothetical protein